MLTHSSSACLVVRSWLIVKAADPSVLEPDRDHEFPRSPMRSTRTPCVEASDARERRNEFKRSSTKGLLSAARTVRKLRKRLRRDCSLAFR